MATEELYQALKEADEFRIQAHLEAEAAYQRKLRDAYDAWRREDMEKDNPISEKKTEA
jgi:hypothetical protein